MKEALKVIANRYSELQLMKAKDITDDLAVAFASRGLSEEVKICNKFSDLLSDTINIYKIDSDA